jgi:hypothetical protein
LQLAPIKPVAVVLPAPVEDEFLAFAQAHEEGLEPTITSRASAPPALLANGSRRPCKLVRSRCGRIVSAHDLLQLAGIEPHPAAPDAVINFNMLPFERYHRHVAGRASRSQCRHDTLILKCRMRPCQCMKYQHQGSLGRPEVPLCLIAFEEF